MSFEKHLIGFSETHSFSNLVIDYLNDDAKLAPFMAFPMSTDGFKDAIEKRKSFPVDRETLVNTLKAQYEKLCDLDNFSLAISQIELLADEKTFTVTTGHQLNIFTGPLYFIYKIISAINLSEELKKNFPGCNFVPVYWMANEDHDFEEISYVHAPGKKITWQQQQKGASGNISTATLQPVIEELKAAIGESEHALKILKVFETAYNSYRSLTGAMRYMVHHLFGKYGLVIIDAADKNLKSLFKKILKDELLNQFSFIITGKSSSELDKHYKSQVTPRELNLFYMSGDIRERIELHEGKYNIVNTNLSFSREEILRELENYPERFSPNVVLRPLYQESILPGIAYAGGGAEVSYWLQYKAMFESRHVFFPVLVLRDSVLIIEKNIAKKIKSNAISWSEIFLSYDELAKLAVTRMEDGGIHFNDESLSIEKLFDDITSKVSSVDPTLSGAAQAEKQKALNALKALEDKTLKALKRKNETSLNQLKLIKDKLFPENSLQERFFNFSMFYAKYGDEFFSVLKNSLNPFQKKFIILVETD